MQDSINVLEKPHWETTLLGIDPSFQINSFINDDNTEIKSVSVEYIEYIPFENKTVIENGKMYKIDLIINLEEVLVNNGDTFEFKTSKIKAAITEI